jgi:predicted NAD/FAD-binding protein
MNQLQAIDAQYPLFVTLNPLRPVAPELVFDTHSFRHPIYSMDAVAAQRRMASLQGSQNTWFCGAYLKNGFHEDGLSSAVDVARRLGAGVPWH